MKEQVYKTRGSVVGGIAAMMLLFFFTLIMVEAWKPILYIIGSLTPLGLSKLIAGIGMLSTIIAGRYHLQALFEYILRNLKEAEERGREMYIRRMALDILARQKSLQLENARVLKYT